MYSDPKLTSGRHDCKPDGYFSVKAYDADLNVLFNIKDKKIDEENPFRRCVDKRIATIQFYAEDTDGWVGRVNFTVNDRPLPLKCVDCVGDHVNLSNGFYIDRSSSGGVECAEFDEKQIPFCDTSCVLFF